MGGGHVAEPRSRVGQSQQGVVHSPGVGADGARRSRRLQAGPAVDGRTAADDWKAHIHGEADGVANTRGTGGGESTLTGGSPQGD